MKPNDLIGKWFPKGKAIEIPARDIFVLNAQIEDNKKFIEIHSIDIYSKNVVLESGAFMWNGAHWTNYHKSLNTIRELNKRAIRGIFNASL